MTYYTKEDYIFHSVKDVLKPTICKSCQADGQRIYGACEQCLKNQAHNKEYCETHLFEVATEVADYHSSDYDTIKSVRYHLENEKPYLYYGIELEIGFDEDLLQVVRYDDYDERVLSDDCRDMLEEFEKATHGIFGAKEFDSTVRNGIEFISRPMSYAAWTDKNTVQYLKDGMEILKNYGALVDQPDGHGMHIHISRKFFDFDSNGRNNDAERAYKDMDWLFQFFQPELEKIGGREYREYCDSKMMKLKQRYGIGEVRSSECYADLKLTGVMKKGGDMADGDHHNAVITSGRTIEARIFHSTVDYEQILGNIELVRNFAHAVRDESTTGKTLNNILHTKDNLFLDTVLDKVRKRCYKQKKEFDLEKVVEDEMEIK